DVVVYAVDEGKDGGRIIGHSRLVNTNDYSEKGLVQGLDVPIAQTDARTEYEIVMSLLNAFLKESEVSLREIAMSGDQLAFTAAELDIEPDRINIAAAAELLARQKERRLSHELLYGIGRQDIALDWAVLYRKPEEELREAITRSVTERIIRAVPDKEVEAFLQTLREAAVKQVLDDKKTDAGNALNEMLSTALPKETQRLSFMKAVNTYTGSDFRDFWNKHLPAQPEFKDNPQLISNLLLNQQLTLLTGDHQALVKELQVNRELDSIDKLMDLESSDWLEIVKKTGVPDFVEGKDDDSKRRRYTEQMQNMLNAAFPTQRIARMVAKDQIPIEKNEISRGIAGFLSKNAHFDFAASRVHDFDKEIKAAAGNDAAEVKRELMKIQRVFQVSPGPQAMATLLEHGLHSAYTVANIPRKSFMKTYSGILGGEEAASTIHQRASHMAAKTELAAMHMLEYSQGYLPQAAMGTAEYNTALTVLQNHVPNYTELFGSPDICECEHCRSVYSAAAYFIDLLRFLRRGEPNSNGKTPFDMLLARRPDLQHLPLTCENTNTVIPYIDLANEVMEYYTAHDALTNFKGYDTGEATVEELRANPQNFNLEAYRKLKDAKYPFTLPYHQPLDVIRTYSDHLKVSRYEATKAMNPAPSATTAKAIAAEALRISEEEHKVVAGKAFDGTADNTALYVYFGYNAADQLEGMSAVPEFLRRSGITYKDLVELVKTQFINPFQGTLDFLEKIFAHASTNASTIYTKLGQIAAGALDPAADANITAALTAYNNAQGTNITPADFGQWVTAHLGEFRQVITLYEPDSRCDLETTKLRTIQSIYENAANSGLSTNTWSKIHRFIRLWRKLGWTLHETDLMLAALGETDITDATVGKLEAVALLKTATNLALSQLAVLWGNIDTYDNKSLYKKLFLNKAVQQIDPAFKADAWGDYLQDGNEVLGDHQSAILAAFRMREDDLAAILTVAKVIDGGNPRPLDLNTDILNLANLSTNYRHVVLAKALKLRVTDLCKLIALFSVSPFSAWNIQQKKFTNIAPNDTYEFYQLAESTKKTGFKVAVMEYILQGTLPPESTIGLAPDKAR
ncbi:MAG: Tc toxin subunit A, partial [Phycisphaerales bacterium]|nr:Tc toxin subunit A [Phycisphaerales bacterium]